MGTVSSALGSLEITDRHMRSGSMPHHAEPVNPNDQYGQWRVSWLPGREVDRDQAITAMQLALTVAAGHTEPGGRYWPFVRGWAEELGLTAEAAVELLTTSQEGAS